MLIFLVFLILLFLVGKSLLNMSLAAAGAVVGLVLFILISVIKRRK